MSAPGLRRDGIRVDYWRLPTSRLSAVTLRLAWLALGIPFGMGVEYWIWTR